MKKIKTKLSAFLSLALLGSSIPTQAQVSDTEGDRAERRAQFLEQFDLNGDGELSLEELRNAREVQAAERIAHFMAEHDLDQNGVISLAELTLAAAARVAESQLKLLEKFDTNNDNIITADELGVVDETAIAKRAAELLERLDVNEDGEITADEVKSRSGKSKSRGRNGGRRGPQTSPDGVGQVGEGNPANATESEAPRPPRRRPNPRRGR